MLKIVVYADGKDGDWVTAAVRAVQQFTRRNIVISRKVTDADWVFWLSSQPLPAGLKAANILFYEQGKEVPVDTWVRGIGVAVEKMTAMSSAAKDLDPVWMDGFGKPLLGLESTAGGRRFHFFSHFDPAWNGLVWSAEFPKCLQELLFEKGTGDHDRRVIDPAQIAPGKGVGNSGAMAAEIATIDLAPAGWILIWVLLMIERMLAFKKSSNNG